jgi:hypothetical protein
MCWVSSDEQEDSSISDPPRKKLNSSLILRRRDSSPEKANVHNVLVEKRNNHHIPITQFALMDLSEHGVWTGWTRVYVLSWQPRLT